MTTDTHASRSTISISTCFARRRRVAKQAFVQQIVPGVIGGICSALALYPLEVLETILQGEAAGACKSSVNNHMNTSPLRPAFAGAASVAIPQAQPARRTVTAATSVLRKGELLRGFDTALMSAIIGYTAFFGVFELTSLVCVGTNPAMLLTRNLFAAFIAFICNSPFQLLKTRLVLQGVTAIDALRQVTQNGKQPRQLWRGFLANVLGISFTALQLTLAAACPPGASSLQTALFGCAVTAVAALATYPLLTVRTAVMADSQSNTKCLERIVTVWRKMWSEGTIYNGLGASLVRQVCPAFILFGIQSVLGG